MARWRELKGRRAEWGPGPPRQSPARPPQLDRDVREARALEMGMEGRRDLRAADTEPEAERKRELKRVDGVDVRGPRGGGGAGRGRGEQGAAASGRGGGVQEGRGPRGRLRD